MEETAEKGYILVIDDDPCISELLKKFLNIKGYSVITSGNGVEGLKIFREKQPLMVLLDINMPVMNGVETLKKMKNINQEIGIIMISGFAEEDTAKKCLELGASDYVTKPFDWKYLEITVLSKIFPIIG